MAVKGCANVLRAALHVCVACVACWCCCHQGCRQDCHRDWVAHTPTPTPTTCQHHLVLINKAWHPSPPPHQPIPTPSPTTPRRTAGVQRPVEGDCPICCEEMHAGGPAKEAVTFCGLCGNNMHKECFGWVVGD